jgi:DNA-directed RNA polymerase subunit beta'
MSFQAFEPVLVKEKDIRLHPLVCSAFNADFDGDQMGAHLPVGIDAQIESRILMLSCRNLFSPATGKLVEAFYAVKGERETAGAA